MSKYVRAVALAAFTACGMTAVAVAAEKPEPAQKEKDKKEVKGELLKTIIDATAEFDKDKKKLTINATGQVNTGGWTSPKLTRKQTKGAPKDGIYEYEMTAVRPDGIVLQVISKVKATEVWENPPADLKGVKILGDETGSKTVKIGK